MLLAPLRSPPKTDSGRVEVVVNQPRPRVGGPTRIGVNDRSEAGTQCQFGGDSELILRIYDPDY